MEFHNIISIFFLAITISLTTGAAINSEQVEFVITDPNYYGPVPISYVDPSRIKRSGSGDILGQLKNGIQSKLSQFAKASSGSIAHFSKHSSSGSSGSGHSGSGHSGIGHSGSGGYGGGYEYGASGHDAKSFDFWTLKKSILSTLLQAVKAIKGGVIAIKGQLIKGGGNLISAKGRLISMKGEAIANLGKHIATSAMLVPAAAPYAFHPDEVGPSGHSGLSISHSVSSHSSPVHSAPAHSAPAAEYGPPSSGFAVSHVSSNYGAPEVPSANYGVAHSSNYGAPSSNYGAPIQSYEAPAVPAQHYGATSGPSAAYLPQKFNAALEAIKHNLPRGVHAGLVILKKIPTGGLDVPHGGVAQLPLQDERNNHHSTSDVSNLPDFKPLEESHSSGKYNSLFETAFKENYNLPAPILSNHGSLDSDKHLKPVHESNPTPIGPSAPPSGPMSYGTSGYNGPVLPTINGPVEHSGETVNGSPLGLSAFAGPTPWTDISQFNNKPIAPSASNGPIAPSGSSQQQFPANLFNPSQDNSLVNAPLIFEQHISLPNEGVQTFLQPPKANLNQNPKNSYQSSKYTTINAPDHSYPKLNFDSNLPLANFAPSGLDIHPSHNPSSASNYKHQGGENGFYKNYEHNSHLQSLNNLAVPQFPGPLSYNILKSVNYELPLTKRQTKNTIPRPFQKTGPNLTGRTYSTQ